ncbi:MAG: glycosyl hydrolase family 28-related protein [Bacillota bacterium]
MTINIGRKTVIPPGYLDTKVIDAQLSGMAINVKHPPAPLVAAKGDNVTDDTAVIQAAINYLMTNGGGTLEFPPGDYVINGTLYTHQDTFDNNDRLSPIEFRGATPVFSDLFNTKKRNVTRLIKRNSGVILAVNYTTTQECVYTGVYRNLKVRNIAFYGTGTTDVKYTNVQSSVTTTTGIEMRMASITLEDCLFWRVNKGVAQPDTVLGGDNYCDQSVYKRLAFRDIGTVWLELQRSDASTIENLNGYDMAKTCLYGIKARKGESFTVKEVLVAGKGMHLCPNFKLVNLDYCNGVEITSIYVERVEGVPIFLDNCKNVNIGVIDARHYGRTFVKGTNNRNVSIGKIYAHIEENKILSPADPGDYSVYDTVSNAIDIDFDNTNYDIRFDHFFVRNGVHSGGAFSETTARLNARLNTGSKAYYQIGKQYVFDVIYDSANSKFVANANGTNIDFTSLFACSANPTFNTGTGELTFPSDGAFTNVSAAHVSGRRSGTGVINNAYKVTTNPLTVRVLNTSGAIITITADVALSVTMHI